MPYRESFAWAIIPLFENNNVASAGGAASPSSPLTPSISASSSQDSVAEPLSKINLDAKLAQYSSRSSVVVEISNLNKVKESYTEESLQVIVNSISSFGAFNQISFLGNMNLWHVMIHVLFLLVQQYILLLCNHYGCSIFCIVAIKTELDRPVWPENLETRPLAGVFLQDWKCCLNHMNPVDIVSFLRKPVNCVGKIEWTICNKKEKNWQMQSETGFQPAINGCWGALNHQHKFVFNSLSSNINCICYSKDCIYWLLIINSFQ